MPAHAPRNEQLLVQRLANQGMREAEQQRANRIAARLDDRSFLRLFQRGKKLVVAELRYTLEHIHSKLATDDGRDRQHLVGPLAEAIQALATTSRSPSGIPLSGAPSSARTY